ncbi:MAG: electron transfer flavoprotein subunit alpha/FixB family protein, partial [Flavobacteriia bacterium]|nr:electron transfer flavoprotein subunit alpha/FixB family protein [Flavobacteriia bacterium]
MNILVYINTASNLAKSALETVTYASKIGGSVSVVATG